MYSDDESVASSYSSGHPPPPRAASEQSSAGGAPDDQISQNAAPVFVESDSDDDDDRRSGEGESGYHGAVEASTVPEACLERCAVFLDAALFDPRTASGDANERVVECSMRVVDYPFCRPTAAAPTQTLLYTPVVSASGMTKNMRSITAEKWEQLIRTQHGIPCTSEGTNTGFEELHRTERTYHGQVHGYCHTVKDANRKGARGGSSGTSADAQMHVALNESQLFETLPDIFWNTVNAAVQACRAERTPIGVAFLTTQKRQAEVCQCLLWLQRQSEVSLPRYQVFTVESVLGEDWDSLVMVEKEYCSCGYHNHLMTNSYGNRRHCCEGTVTAMTKVIEAAVKNL